MASGANSVAADAGASPSMTGSPVSAKRSSVFSVKTRPSAGRPV